MVGTKCHLIQVLEVIQTIVVVQIEMALKVPNTVLHLIHLCQKPVGHHAVDPDQIAPILTNLALRDRIRHSPISLDQDLDLHRAIPRSQDLIGRDLQLLIDL